MATTDDEWERLFRQRLENYESEPEDNALERILEGAQPPAVKKPGGGLGHPYGWSLALLGLMAIIAVRISSYWDLKHAVKPISGNSSGKTAQTAPTTVFEKTVIRATPEENTPADNRSQLRAASPQIAPDQRIVTLGTPLSQQPPKLVQVPAGQMIMRYVEGEKVEIVTSELENEMPGYEVGERATHPIIGLDRSGLDRSGLDRSELLFEPIASRQHRRLFLTGSLPAVPPVSAASTRRAAAIEPARYASRPVFRTSVMPLYTFRELTPMRQDDIVMEKIRPATDLSARTGWRVQAGAEWDINRVLGFRVGLVYQQLQQQFTYTARALRSDSAKVEWVDPRTIKLTPLYQSQERQVRTVWRYVALSAEGRWQLSPGAAGVRHYLVAGGSAGYLIDGKSQQKWQPFLQASYGIERRLTTNLRLQVEPGIVYNLRVMQDYSRIFSVRPYSYGLTVGVRWQPEI
ncbi:hypothetical protein GCM10027347_06170 [Larkinella harenae]